MISLELLNEFINEYLRYSKEIICDSFTIENNEFIFAKSVDSSKTYGVKGILDMTIELKSYYNWLQSRRENKINKIYMKQNILNTISDLCSDFLYYDRKEDDELSADQLVEAVKIGEITIDEMVNEFRKNLENSLL